MTAQICLAEAMERGWILGGERGKGGRAAGTAVVWRLSCARGPRICDEGQLRYYGGREVEMRIGGRGGIECNGSQKSRQ